jgi:translation initiation factor 2B subunit (eIF-2B alpha/beta/delta family)
METPPIHLSPHQSTTSSARIENIKACYELLRRTYFDDNNIECHHSIQYATIKALNDFVSQSSERTTQGMTSELNECCDFIIKEAIDTNLLKGKSAIIIKSLCQYYKSMAFKNFQEQISSEEIKDGVVRGGHLMLAQAEHAHNKIIKCSKKLITNGQTILIHGFSSVVGKVLIAAAQRGL